MIKMLSINNFDNLDKINNTCDLGDDETTAEDFSALLASLSISSAPAEIKLPLKQEKETLESTQPIGVNQSLSPGDEQIKPAEIRLDLTFIQATAHDKNVENISAGNCSPFSKNENEQIKNALFTQLQATENTSFTSANRISEDFNEIPRTEEAQTATFNFLVKSNEDITQLQNAKPEVARKKESQISENEFFLDDFQSLTVENDVIINRFPKANSAEMKSEPKVNVSFSSFENKFPENAQLDSLSKITPDFSLFPSKNLSSPNFPNLFRDVNEELKSTESEISSEQADSPLAFIPDNEKSAEPQKIERNQNFGAKTEISHIETTTTKSETADSAFVKPEPKIEFSKPELPKKEALKADTETTENTVMTMFDKFLSSVGKEPKTTQILPPSFNGEKVFEQVSTALRDEILIFTGKTEKTDILKMRLRPAELGAVEVKFEKTESGELRVHFQTETEAARQILVERSEQLRETLQNSGWQIEKLDFSCVSFSSAGESERRDSHSRQYETADNDFRQTDLSGEVSKNGNDSIPNRLVSLRA